MSYAQYSELRKSALDSVLSVLPTALKEALFLLGDGKAIFSDGLSEIRARVGEVSLAVFSGVNLPIRVRLDKKDLADTVSRIHSGALYMHKESMSQGFLSMEYGVRVGIVGTYYEGLAGDITGLVFRIPFFCFEIGQKLREVIEDRGALRSALIYSPPAVGKTTAIRSLALALSAGGIRRVAVVDERREFPSCLAEHACLDILSGYKKDFGIEVATRVLNPEIIIIDELGNEKEAEAVLFAVSHGVPVVATAHATNEEELFLRPKLKELIKSRAFEIPIALYRQGRKYGFCVSEWSDI